MNKEMNGDLTNIVCCHKNDWYYAGPGYMPIHVGKAISSADLGGMQGDDTGDNISAKNPNFCELTAHYWLWKNGVKTKYVGLSHYRRYFDFNTRLPYGTSVKYGTPSEYEKTPPYIPDLDRLFEKYDIVLAKPNLYSYSLKMDYCYCHIIEDYETMENVIKELYPEYSEAFNHVMSRNKLSPFNMFIMPWEEFDRYSKWLFDILFEVEKRVKISEYPGQARIFGYMSERLLNVYAYHHKMKVKYVPVTKLAPEPPRNAFHYAIGAVKKNLTAYLLRKSLF